MSRECVLGEVSTERIRKHVEHICSRIPIARQDRSMASAWRSSVAMP